VNNSVYLWRKLDLFAPDETEAPGADRPASDCGGEAPLFVLAPEEHAQTRLERD
jgi:hypothetical protein